MGAVTEPRKDPPMPKPQELPFDPNLSQQRPSPGEVPFDDSVSAQAPSPGEPVYHEDRVHQDVPREPDMPLTPGMDAFEKLVDETGKSLG